ncbi:phage portal protein [Candidatus Regiella insecticola]|uniref:Phage portal protein pbsx family n=2 Tax=Candidatus Regiella insecticola TaxID=138073 RepID=A0A6L2ZP01_9ENTR|nr:phage portal protein [Candidatus Regiella insecticola]GFN46476.1 phage portal protein pbsx family [Candidatus Regiella insecticola]
MRPVSCHPFNRKKRHPIATQHMKQTTPPRVEAFTFGDPIPMLDQRDMLDYLECAVVEQWYEPPVSFQGLAKSFRAAVHHSSPIYMKRNLLVSLFQPHRYLSKQDFSRYALDFLVFANAFLEVRTNRLGGVLKLVPSPAKYTRCGVEPGTHWYVQSWADPHRFAAHSVFHLLDPDINQEVYGVPDYLASLNSSWLNEAATLFRRKYYLNGSHAGFILYMNDAAHQQEDIDRLRQALKDAKGPGNFRNLFMYAPGGKKDGLQLIPLAEVAAKDEFINIKNVTRDDQLAAQRVPPQLMGILPHNTGGFGDIEKAARVFAINELAPLQERLSEINAWLGEEVIRFKPYELVENASM